MRSDAVQLATACRPPRIRHRYDSDGRCSGCGQLREPNDPPAAETTPAALPAGAVAGAHAVPIPSPPGATLTKLQVLKSLTDDAVASRERLAKFIRQHGGVDVPEDPLMDSVRVMLDGLYADFGREVFWQELNSTPPTSKG